jgi:RNA polymerase sigma-70 factor (ECF subfamily)
MIRPTSETLSDPVRASSAELVGLVQRAIAADPTAQRELVERYGRRVAGFVRPLIRQPDAVEDVTQTVFIKMFRRLAGLRDLALFEAWLFTLARNTALDFIRRRNRRPFTVGFDASSIEVPDQRNDTATVEIMEALDRALTRLSPVDQMLVRQFVAGESYLQIAAQAGLSLGAVKVRLHRVRPLLRNWVGTMTESRLPGERRRRAA